MGRVSGGQLSHAASPGRIWRIVRKWVTGGRRARLPVRSTRAEQARLRTGVTRGLIVGRERVSPQTVLARCCGHQAETDYRSYTQDAFHGLASFPLRLPGSALRSGDRRAVNLDEYRGVRGRRVSHPDRRGAGSRARIETLPDPTRRLAITPARRHRTLAFVEREGVQDPFRHPGPPVLAFAP